MNMKNLAQKKLELFSIEGHQHCLDNKLFTEFCPKMVAAAVDFVEEIILEQKRA